MNIFETMKQMDVNGDGLVEFGEMKSWFQTVGDSLDDVSFKNILESLRDSAETMKALKLAKELGKQ